MKTWDAIVIGSGHNGLVTACYLQRAGLDVLVLEKNEWIGGAAASRELHRGYTYSNCSYVCSLLRPEIMRDLELPRFGLQIVPQDSSAVFTRDGGYLAIYRHPDARRREIARFSARDAEAFELFSRDVLRQCRFIRPLLMRRPPDPASLRVTDLRELADLARHVHGLSETEMYDTIRFWTTSVAEFLDDYFETEALKAHLAIAGIVGTGLGPMSPGTAYVLLHHYMGDVDGTVGAWGYARGGMGAVTAAMAASFEASGGTLRRSAPVDRVLVAGGKAVGVVLDGGEEIRAKAVISNLDVKRTFLTLVQDEELPDDFVKKIRNFKIRGSSAKVNVALDAMPRFPALPERSPCLRGDLHFTDSIERMERAYDEWKLGRLTVDPVLDVVIPTTVDPSMTRPGEHFMSCFVQYCPAKVEGRDWTDADRDTFGQTVIDQIASHSPDVKSLIAHMEVRTPRDLEEEVGLTEGNIFHGEITFDQLLFNRPVPGYARYRSPVAGLYMCGSSTHPGGGVMGAPGRNAAAEILRDLHRPRKDMSDGDAVL